MNFRQLLAKEISLPAAELDQLTHHYEKLREWNSRMNLIRIQSLDELVRLHYCESIFLAETLPQGQLRLADVGSGAGFPGIPIAAHRPETRATLVESHQRKAVFLRQASVQLNNIEVIAVRAESLSVRYDWVVSRAVRPILVLGLNISSNFALLISEDELRSLPEPSRVVKSPWGRRRIAAMFHVEHDTIGGSRG